LGVVDPNIARGFRDRGAIVGMPPTGAFLRKQLEDF